MKIDIHTHTRKCKSGDAPTRDVSAEEFCETVLSTDVGIVAITNHNVFDLEQFESIISVVGEDLQVWPGIELDVDEGTSRGQMLVITSPGRAKELAGIVDEVTQGFTPDTFATTIGEILQNFDALEPIYVAHYKQKMPSLSEHALEELIAGTSTPARVIKEVTNAISAGIYISHGYASIYGSDHHDWSTYPDIAGDLPDLRLPVESFEHFCLLLEKDSVAINTVLDKKTSETLLLTPFDDGTSLELKAFNDINIVFGPKGTGKTCILRAIAKHYSDKGVDATVYEPASDRLDEIFDTKGHDLSLDLKPYGISYCKAEIEQIREASEVGVTSLSKYLSFFQTKATNKNAKKIKLKDIEPQEEGRARRTFEEFNEATKKTAEFLGFLNEHPAISGELNETELNEIIDTLSQLHSRLEARQWQSFSGWKETALLNSAITKIRNEIERKTGTPAKPTSTGLRDYAFNRAKIEAAAAAIIKSFSTEIPIRKERVGSLGPDKGELEFRTEFRFQNGFTTDGKLKQLRNVNKGPQKKFALRIQEIKEHAFDDDLFQHITELNSIDDIEHIETVYELLIFRRYFALDGLEYTPSSGEASMVMLHKELETDKEVYILDEPERSLGNEYISDVIVPLIKERARAGKSVFISTHDANIAVRTLPYSSVYRKHGPAGYSTFIGNPFSNNLVNLDDDQDQLDWKKISMQTLEGGEEAFGERGKIYAND